MAGHRLVSTRREVPEAARERYDALWAELAAEAKRLGSRAWRFASTEAPRQCLEFLEFGAGTDPRRDPAARLTLQRLDAEVAPGVVEEWDER